MEVKSKKILCSCDDTLDYKVQKNKHSLHLKLTIQYFFLIKSLFYSLEKHNQLIKT